ncbi:heavy-metal-associated domain-containing protein [Psychroserpens luteolus]|uniref:heavy-metal-associated domain-containing protein n=1 Tax=Psychroserpens luteolus TaxID=2855840 RepID=UPI001E3402E0|nr:heavy-metal-associated domain-containing protein [Psychroserpens luteolus]MCD2259599.1 heavy-metal-associated domain-containing protein [Psychroserpens luteolus]
MRATVHIENLKSCGCKRTIVNALSQVKHISDVDVNIEANTTSFDFQTHYDFDNAKRVLSRIGYPIVGTENKLIS